MLDVNGNTKRGRALPMYQGDQQEKKKIVQGARLRLRPKRPVT